MDALDDFEDYLYDEMRLFDEVLKDKTYSETKKTFSSSSWWTKCSKDFNVNDEKLEKIFEDVKKDRLRKLAKKQSGSGRGSSMYDSKSVRGMGVEISQWRKEQNIGARKIALSREKAANLES